MTLQFNAMTLAILILSAVQGCSDPDSSATAAPSAPVLAVHYESAPLIPVTIAGEQYQFLLDTGASITVIDRRLASRFKALSLSELPRAYQADFANVAREISQDGSAAQGGDLGWATAGMFVPEFEEAMNRLAPNEISAPLVSRFGVHLIQVLERKDVELSPKAQRDQLKQLVREQKMEEAYKRWIEEVRSSAYVEYRDAPQ